MHVLVPTPLTDAMLSSSTIAEPAAGETAWASGGTYALGDRCIRTQTHRVYEAKIAHNGRTTPPETDTTYWQDVGPTQRWAMFDNTVSTQSTATTSLTVVLRPGFFNAFRLYGVEAATLVATLKEAPGGATLWTKTFDLTEPPLDWYDWAFGRIKPLTKVGADGLLPCPDAELTLTLSAATGTTVKCGMVVVGDYRPLIGDDAEFGGTQYGATAEPVDFSYIKADEFGNTSIKKRRNATDMRVQVVLPQKNADFALQTVQEVLATPCAWVATDVPGYGGLDVFGLGSGPLVYPGPNHVEFSIYVKGLV